MSKTIQNPIDYLTDQLGLSEEQSREITNLSGETISKIVEKCEDNEALTANEKTAEERTEKLLDAFIENEDVQTEVLKKEVVKRRRAEQATTYIKNELRKISESISEISK